MRTRLMERRANNLKQLGCLAWNRKSPSCNRPPPNYPGQKKVGRCFPGCESIVLGELSPLCPVSRHGSICLAPFSTETILAEHVAYCKSKNRQIDRKCGTSHATTESYPSGETTRKKERKGSRFGTSGPKHLSQALIGTYREFCRSVAGATL